MAPEDNQMNINKTKELPEWVDVCLGSLPCNPVEKCSVDPFY